MKKYFLSPLFMPLFISILWLLSMNIIFAFFSGTLPQIAEDGELIENLTHILYILMLVSFVVCYRDFFNLRTDYFVFLFLGLCAFLRESGIQHHLASRDTTPFKSRFFTNPDNPLSEKIIFGLVLLIVFGAVAYLAIKYARYLVSSFLKFRLIGWSSAVLCTMLVLCKFVDRFPSNYKHYTGEHLSQPLFNNMMLIEESGEMLLPLIVIIFLAQYHQVQKERWG